MKLFIVAALFVAAAVAAPATPDGDAKVIVYDSDNIGLDKYFFNVETSNKILLKEEGGLKNIGTENEALEVRGQFSYIGDDGKTYTIEYIANEGGFQPQGPHIPQ